MIRRSVTAQYLAEVAWRAAVDAMAQLSDEDRLMMLNSPSAHFRTWWRRLCKRGSMGVAYLKIDDR